MLGECSAYTVVCNHSLLLLLIKVESNNFSHYSGSDWSLTSSSIMPVAAIQISTFSTLIVDPRCHSRVSWVFQPFAYSLSLGWAPSQHFAHKKGSDLSTSLL